MDHNLQVLLAIGISAALCLVTWIWARRGRGGVFMARTVDGKERGVKAATGLRIAF
jgi:hypothetical protein